MDRDEAVLKKGGAERVGQEKSLFYTTDPVTGKKQPRDTVFPTHLEAIRAMLEAISPDAEALFSPEYRGLPVLHPDQVIMEIKYGDRCPSFARKLTNVSCKQLSVSKYALCREIFL